MNKHARRCELCRAFFEYGYDSKLEQRDLAYKCPKCRVSPPVATDTPTRLIWGGPNWISSKRVNPNLRSRG